MRLVHYLPSAVEYLGLGPAAYAEQNLSPRHATNETLRWLACRMGWHTSIHALTLSPRPYSTSRDGVTFCAHPVMGGSLCAGLKCLCRPTQLVSPHFARFLQRSRVDLFVFYGVSSSVFSYSLARSLRARGVPYIATVTGHSCRRNVLTLSLLRGARAVVARADSIADEVAQSFNLDRNALSVIPNGVNTDVFFPDRRPMPSREPRLCFVGRLTPQKGFLEALECVAFMVARGVPAVMEVAGDYVSDDYRKRCERFMAARELESRVALHGWLEAGPLARVYNRADLLLFPSRTEGLSRTVLEAMACGTPVAAVSGTGGHTALIDDSNGVLAGADEFNEKVLALFSDRQALSKRSEAAGSLVLRGFSSDVTRKRLTRLYQQCVPKAPQSN